MMCLISCNAINLFAKLKRIVIAKGELAYNISRGYSLAKSKTDFPLR